jgi:hypothetical protein
MDIDNILNATEKLNISDDIDDSINSKDDVVNEDFDSIDIGSSLSNLCEVPPEPVLEVKPEIKVPRRRGRPKGSSNNKNIVKKRKPKVQPEIIDYSHVDPNIIPDPILEPLKMTIYAYQAKIEGLLINFYELFELMEPTIDETDNFLALHCNFAHKINKNIPDELKERCKKTIKKKPTSKKKRFRKSVGDGTCFNTCFEIYIMIKHPDIPKDKFYKMKCASSTGQIQIPGGLLKDQEDCRMVVNTFIDHLKKYNICDQNAYLESDKISMRNYITRINIQPGLDLCTYKLCQYFYNIEHQMFDDFEGEFIDPPFSVTEVKNPDEHPKVSFKFYYGPGPKDSFRVDIFNNQKKLNIGKINFKGTKNDTYVHMAYDYIAEMIKKNWNIFIVKQPNISKIVESDSDSDSDSD